jgi:Xaa-Pro aminopeptidase
VEIHERPFVSPVSRETLRQGNVISCEPGIYLPGKFGVRIEDIAVITSNGCENLVKLDKELIEL